MQGIKIVIKGLRDFAKGKPDDRVELVQFQISTEIADDDEMDLGASENVYPSMPDVPLRPQGNIEALQAWRERCQVLISGIHVPVGLQYVDAKGNLTNRKVEVNKLFKDGPGPRYFSGLCFLRERHRSFREDRMQEIIELETGEVFEKPYSFFRKYSLFDSPIMEELQVMIHILTYLARTDRKYLDEEKQFISEVISTYCQDERKPAIENYAFTHKVKKKDFMGEIEKLEFMEERFTKHLLRHAEGLIKIDGTIHPKELELLGLLKGEV